MKTQRDRSVRPRLVRFPQWLDVIGRDVFFRNWARVSILEWCGPSFKIYETERRVIEV